MTAPTREQLIHALYEAAELEHDLMCTYLYAAFSLRSGETEGLSAAESEAVARWRRTLVRISVEEMGHLVAVWNITAAVGGTPRFGRSNFPLTPGELPASVVVRLAPFNEAVLQHFIHLERPAGSAEPDGAGFGPTPAFIRGVPQHRLVPMGVDYDTIGAFYASLATDLRAFVAQRGERDALCGDPALQLSPAEVELVGARPVRCLDTAVAALATIVEQGEGAPGDSANSHYQRFAEIRTQLATLRAANPSFEPAWPAAENPVLRPPWRREGRVWIEHEEAARVVDLANAAYGLMLRLLAYSYLVPRPSPEKRLAVELSLGLMRAMTHLAERAARLPAGPSSPTCNAGVSFTSLRDAAPLPHDASARFFLERLGELVAAAARLDRGDPRVTAATRILRDLKARADRGFPMLAPAAVAVTLPPPAPLRAGRPPLPTRRDGVDVIEGRALRVLYDGKRCIHARHCVTGGPGVFLANVEGPWIDPDAAPVAKVVELAHACPSGAIRYQRKDGLADEPPPPVNLIAIRENGPYAVRADLRLQGAPLGYRLTLCRCGASKDKPYCDGSHHDVAFVATGEPATQGAAMLAVRDGELELDPELDGPLHVRGNLELTSGTGRVIARVAQARLCRCGSSGSKPFCDGSHQRVGFRAG